MTFEMEILGSRMLLRKDDNGLSRQLREQGTREGHWPDTVAGVLKPGMKCLDVGANLGFYALLEARCVGPQGAVYAVEPELTNAELLLKSTALNGYDWMHTYRLAFGDREGMGHFRVMRNSNTGNLFDRAEASPWWGQALDEHEIGWQEVFVTTMDAFCEHHDLTPDFLRMDVEGFEDRVIAGGGHTLARMKAGSGAFIEFHPLCYADPVDRLQPAIDAMVTAGFRLVEITPEFAHGVPVEELCQRFPSGCLHTQWVKA